MKHLPQYMSGFRNHFSTEAMVGALPHGQNSPQQCPFDLYAEQLSGSAFTAPRAHNLRSWLYRIRPSVVQSRFQRFDLAISEYAPANPTPMRWGILPVAKVPTDFIEGRLTICGNGDPLTQSGIAIAQYAFNCSMSDKRRFFYNADAELLIIPQLAALQIRTELGELKIEPSEIAVIPRGLKFQVNFANATDECARGYVCDNRGAPFELPNLGPIGSNGLANVRDFLTPVAAYENIDEMFELIAQFGGHFWRAEINHSPLDVVAWHGNYAPYKYDLRLFNAINTVSFDHCDPSIFTVLTSPSMRDGVANCDFVIFPPRWMVAEHTFRPPWFHRNIMSEFMGLITGVYDAKAEGFVAGGASLHNCMSPHGPDAATFEKAAHAYLSPEYLDNTLAFMLESQWILQPTQAALDVAHFEVDYTSVWQSLTAQFKAE